MKGLPMTYNRDLQEDKLPAFDAADTLLACVEITAAMIPSIEVRAEAMLEATKDGFLEATDAADYLASKGMPFREAHKVVGALVLHCVREGKRLPELSLDELRAHADLFEEDVRDWLATESILARRKNPGATAPERVREAIAEARKRLE
jgi:argininosuccinate lyase